jgi:uncharacterized protein YecT (DUF1311 family)
MRAIALGIAVVCVSFSSANAQRALAMIEGYCNAEFEKTKRPEAERQTFFEACFKRKRTQNEADVAAQPSVPAGQRASFDCSKAKSGSARLICGDPALSEADRELGETFQGAIAKLDPAQRRAKLEEQVSWIRERNVRCGLDNKPDAPISDLKPSWQCMMDALLDRKASFTGEKLTPSVASQSSAPSANVDVGRGEDIRGVKLGMRAGHLPAEFNNLVPRPSKDLAAAFQIDRCVNIEANMTSCMIVLFDDSADKRVYAIVLTNLKLGSFNDPTVAEQLIIQKYGKPLYSFRGGITTNLLWHSSVNFTDSSFIGLGQKMVLDPGFVSRIAPGFENQGDVSMAEISRPLIGGTYIHFAALTAVDVKTSFRMRQASERIVSEMRGAAQRQELERVPKPRF